MYCDSLRLRVERDIILLHGVVALHQVTVLLTADHEAVRRGPGEGGFVKLLTETKIQSVELSILQVQSGTILRKACISLEAATYGETDLSVVLESDVGVNVAGEPSKRVVDLHIVCWSVLIVAVTTSEENDWRRSGLKFSSYTAQP